MSASLDRLIDFYQTLSPDEVARFAVSTSLGFPTADSDRFKHFVEDALEEHPAVAAASVFGVPDDYWGEILVAAVEMRDPSVTVEDLKAQLGDKLGPINWQFMATKKFDPEDFEGFLAVTASATGFTHQMYISHELHAHCYNTFSFTHFTASAFHIETKKTRFVSSRFC